MWANEDVNEAMNLLLSSGSQLVEFVKTSESTYVVAGESTLTDELYLQAFSRLLDEKQIELIEDKGERKVYRQTQKSS